MSGGPVVPLDEVIRTLPGAVIPGEPLYVLERGEPGRTINGQNLGTVGLTETVVPLYSDPELTTEVVQPIEANAEGRYPYWFRATPIDLYSPNDIVDPIQPKDPAPARPWARGGLLVGFDPDYEPPRDSDFAVADPFGFGAEPGQTGTAFGGSEMIGRVGGTHVDRLSGRTNIQGAIRYLAVGDNAQARFGRGPGWGHGFPIGTGSVVRRRPVGQTTFVGTPAAPGASEVYIFPAKTFPDYFDSTVHGPVVTCQIDGQSVTYAGKTSINATVSGALVVGDTEMLVAEGSATQVLPDAGPWRMRSLQGTYSAKELVFDGVADGLQKAGVATLVVRNVTQAEWDAIPDGAGAIQVARVIDGTRSFKYTAATYDAGTEKATFTIDDRTKIDKNVLDGGTVRVHRLTGVKCSWPHFSVENQLAGSTTLKLRLTDPYEPHDPVDSELIAKIPSSGILRVETKDTAPLGPGKVDFPTARLAYEDFEDLGDGTGEITLTDPLPREVPKNSYIEIEDADGILRDRPSGVTLALHKLTGVAGLDSGAEVGAIAEFSPRYAQPSSGEGGAHIALDYWTGQNGWKGYSTNLTMTHVGGVVGFGEGPTPGPRVGAEIKQMVRVPVSGYQLQKFTVAGRGVAVLGAGVRGHGDLEHNLHVGDVYTRVKPPNITIEEECDCDPEDPECDCEPDEDDPPEEPGSGQIVAATINVATVIGFPTASRMRVVVFNREAGAEETRVLAYTGTTEGPPPAISGITFDQFAEGPKTTLEGAHVLSSITALNVVSATGFAAPATQHAGKWRAIDTDGETILATGTYTGRDASGDHELTGVTVTTGTGTLPDGTLIEENYSIGDFWVDSGAEISLADDVQHAAIGSATDLEWGTDRANGGRVGVTGPLGEHGIQTGPKVGGALTDLLRLYRGSDGKWKVKFAAGAERTMLDSADKGVANGVAPLDSANKVPVTHLPNSILIYQGLWDASTNTPTLSDATGTAGHVFLISATGTRDLGSGSNTWTAGNFIVHNGTKWEEADGTQVISVNGETGTVVLDAADVGAQPVDSDLTAIAALTTTAFGRSLLEQADAATALATLGGQPLDSDLTAVAALTTTAYGRALLELADAVAARATLELPDEFAGIQGGTGRWYSPPCAVFNNTTGANDTIRASPLFFSKAVTVDRLACEVVAGGAGEAGSTYRLGLYADDGTGYPGALLVDGGTVATNTQGEKEVTVSQAVSGLVWATSHVRSAPVTRPTVRMNNADMFPCVATNRTGALAAGPRAGWSATDTSATLPNPFPAGAAHASNTTRIAVRIG